MVDSKSAHQEMTYHLRKPSSFTAAEVAAGPASENTSTKRLPVLVGAAPMGAAERIPRRSADGDGVDWKTKEITVGPQKCNAFVTADGMHKGS